MWEKIGKYSSSYDVVCCILETTLKGLVLFEWLAADYGRDKFTKKMMTARNGEAVAQPGSTSERGFELLLLIKWTNFAMLRVQEVVFRKYVTHKNRRNEWIA